MFDGLEQTDALDRPAVDGNNAITLLQAGTLGRTAGREILNDNMIIDHGGIRADAADQAFESLFEPGAFGGIIIMSIWIVQGFDHGLSAGADGGVHEFLVVRWIHVVSHDARADFIEAAEIANDGIPLGNEHWKLP